MLQNFYKKNDVQYNDYKNSSYTARIRLKSSTSYKLQKESEIKALYKKLQDGMTGLEFVSSFYNRSYEIYMDELSEINDSEENDMSLWSLDFLSAITTGSENEFNENLSMCLFIL